MRFAFRQLGQLVFILCLALGVLAAVFAHLAADAQNRIPVPAAAPTPIYNCPPRPSTAPGRDFNSRKLDFVSFAHQDLTNANFQNAVFKGVIFVGANLTGADFTGATFIDSNQPPLVNDFTFATLDSACFIRATFEADTYFTYANLACTDFSSVDLTAGHAIFGDKAFSIDANRQCRTAFRSTKMSCEFLAQWKELDLSNADIASCTLQMKGRDFSNAKLPGVTLSGVDLDGTSFIRADLTQVHLENASLQKADFTSATLLGAQFQGANLTGASLYDAVLANDPKAGTPAVAQTLASASFAGAHLKNVNLAVAHLSGVSFVNANFYGSNQSSGTQCKTTLANFAGFTNNCATAHGATLYTTNFTNAYLYGVDFGAAIIDSSSFLSAVLIGSSFDGATITTGAGSGAATTFAAAHLEGANLASANYPCTSAGCYDFTDAFFDFKVGGNSLELQLSGSAHNRFSCGATGCTPPTGADVCVQVGYSTATRPPSGGLASLICPSSIAGPCGVANVSGTNPAWKSRRDVGALNTSVPPAWYDEAATYFQPALPENSPLRCQGLDSQQWISRW
jgi:uncharacterized protein YjbI with pentapeptide repeats